jgi:hypothetical protein
MSLVVSAFAVGADRIVGADKPLARTIQSCPLASCRRSDGPFGYRVPGQTGSKPFNPFNDTKPSGIR